MHCPSDSAGHGTFILANGLWLLWFLLAALPRVSEPCDGCRTLTAFGHCPQVEIELSISFLGQPVTILQIHGRFVRISTPNTLPV